MHQLGPEDSNIYPGVRYECSVTNDANHTALSRFITRERQEVDDIKY